MRKRSKEGNTDFMEELFYRPYDRIQQNIQAKEKVKKISFEAE